MGLCPPAGRRVVARVTHPRAYGAIARTEDDGFVGVSIAQHYVAIGPRSAKSKRSILSMQADGLLTLPILNEKISVCSKPPDGQVARLTMQADVLVAISVAQH